jgi:glyoxylase-like metal-dependent hydrolase (beta-lactamase superfamily II)
MGNLSWTIGDVTVTRIAEVEVSLPIGAFIPDATPEALAPHRDWLRPDFLDEADNLTLSIHALVVEAPGRRIVVDTCVGEHVVPGYEGLAEDRTDFLAALAEAGLSRESIDVVLCTHLHFDHVGWNTLRDGDRWVPTFPKARYLFARTEWAYWSAAEASPFTATMEYAVRPIVGAGLADFVETDHRLCETVRLVPTPGHTPGHVSVCIESGGERALITGDSTHHPVQWAEPGWVMPADVDAEAAEATRRRLLAEHGGRGTLVIGTHYPPPTAGYVARGGRGWWFQGRR